MVINVINKTVILVILCVINLSWILTVTKIKQEMTNQDRTKIGHFFDFLLNFSIFVLEIFSIDSQLSCETMFKVSSENIEQCRRETNNEERPSLGPFIS